ncbi:hypothetical protein EUGRSUZ_F02280 [Eucalyptus grandis]|uniref:Uncharacterized protein n=2 Tax=Eucalyptus grandis TaxID=71139 RepID=A0ACC3KIQ4_EUCGR|nr:hypothetical protein EUGRSUZ_F02280 [Eucalyptus grandis]
MSSTYIDLQKRQRKAHKSYSYSQSTIDRDQWIRHYKGPWAQTTRSLFTPNVYSKHITHNESVACPSRVSSTRAPRK